MSEDPTAVTQQTYADVAAAYAEVSARPYPAMPAAMDRLAAAVEPGGFVLDAGCGPARDTVLLRERGLRAYGMDLSAAMLAAGGVPGVLRGDLRALPIADRALAAVWCHAALLHVPRAEVPVVLGGFARVLRPGGVLLLAVAEGDGEGYEDAVQYGGGRRFFVRHRLDQLAPQLNAAGCTVDRVGRRSGHREWLDIDAHLG